MENKSSPVIPVITVCIWGSIYIVSDIVLKQTSPFFLLFCRFLSSSIILLMFDFRHFKRIRREDWKHFLFIGFAGYFLSNAALMLGIQRSSGSLASLINATSPVLVTAFAVVILKEHVKWPDMLSLILSVTGAAIVIGVPQEAISPFGALCCVFSVVVWSYVLIYIKKLTDKYPSVEITSVCMAIAALFSLPVCILYSHSSGETLSFTSSLILPMVYICIFGTALPHALWNYSLGKYGATYCAAFYPLQPIVSVLLGVLLLHETITAPFLIGLSMILFAMVIHGPAKPALLKAGHIFSGAAAKEAKK